MTPKTKFTGLLLFVLALSALFLLAASLSNLQLHPGAPFPGSRSENPAEYTPAFPAGQSYSIPILQGFLALVVLILIIYVPLRMITLLDRKMILRLGLIILLLLVMISILPRLAPGQPVFYPNEPSEAATPPAFDSRVTPLGQPPQAIIWLVIWGIGFGAVLLLVNFISRWRGSDKVEARLGQEAEEAVRAIHTSSDLGNAIIHCYLQMAQILQENQGVDRSSTMTAREFEARLESLGFPIAPIHQLTALFEKARYGKQHMGVHDEEIALDNLNEIIQFCRPTYD